MKPIVIAFLVTVLVLGGAFMLGRHLLRSTTKRWIGFIGIFLVALPFSWTLFYGASSGGGAVLPIPDLIAIAALLAGEFHSGNYSAAGSIPPPFIMTAITSFVAYLICSKQRPDLFKRVR